MSSQPVVLCLGDSPRRSQLASTSAVESVVEVESTAEALDALQERDPDCILTDHDPPTVDCFQLLEAGISAPVIVVVADGSSKLATRVLQAGAASYLDLHTLEDSDAAVVETISRLTTGAEGSPSEMQALKAENERLKRFTSVVAHELRGPVQRANSALDLVAADCDSSYTDNVAESIARLEELIDDFLALAKHGDTAVELEAVDFAAVVDAAWQEYPNATLTVESELPRIEADASRLQQLLTNLFQNAVDHADSGVTIRVGMTDTAAADSAGFYVADDGPGIDSTERQKVFEYGYTGTDDGTGLGLAIVKRIADALGWELQLTESSDGGTRVEFSGVTVV